MTKNFDLSNYAWQANVDYRQHPELYRVGKGEQGVLICEPYKSEILPHWRFRTPELATESSQKIFELFINYLNQDDFVGADMARKFLQMGFTRSRRYANYKGGRKYTTTHELLERGTGEQVKAESATIFYEVWRKAEHTPKYHTLKINWLKN